MVTTAQVEAYLLDWLKVLGNFDVKFNMLLQIISVMDMRQEYEFACAILGKVHSIIADHESFILKFLERVGALDQSDVEKSFLDLQNLYLVLNMALRTLERSSGIVLKCENGVQSFDDKQFEPFITAVNKFIGCVNDIIKLESLSKAVNMDYLSFSIQGLMFGEDSPEFKAWNEYITTAKCANLDSPELVELNENIDLLAKSLFIGKNFIEPLDASSYVAIVGPSFMGKTQTAFNLARARPVFYVNFSDGDGRMQDIYKSFVGISRIFSTILLKDLSTLKGHNISLGTASLLKGSDVKLYTIGLIWHLISFSQEYNWSGSETWFEFYVKKRNISFQPLSLSMFWAKMGKKIYYFYVFLLISFEYRKIGSC